MKAKGNTGADSGQYVKFGKSCAFHPANVGTEPHSSELLYNQSQMASPLGTDGHQRRFLECFAACGRIIEAARWAKLHRNSHYGWMKEDPTYPARFKEAEAKAGRTLEDEAVRRAHHGIRKAIRYKGRIVAYDIEYSDALLITLLKANNPEKYREKSSVEHSAPGGAPLSIKVVFVDPEPK